MRKKLGKAPKSKPRSGDGLSVGLDDKSAGIWNLFGQFDERTEHLRRMIPFIAARETLTGVVENIPAGKQYARYRGMLKLVRVGPKEWGGGVYAVYGKPKAGAQNTIDASRTIFYVQVKRNRMTPPPPEVLVLAKYSPWTLEMLPFSPKRNEAAVVTRKVRRREVQTVTAQRRDDESEWRAALAKTGTKRVTKEVTPPELKTKMVQDIAFEALRLEFGYGGVRASPHWRPAVRAAVQHVKHLWTTKNNVTSVLFKEKNKAWKKWPPNVPSSIRIGELKNMVKFQKRLRISV